MKYKLQVIRKDAGFRSAKAFAEYLGMSVRTYTNYEQGASNLTLEQAWDFADTLGAAMGRYISLDELAGRDFPTSARSPTYSPVDQRIEAAFAKLNSEGRKEAVKRIEEMSELPRYTQKRKKKH